MASYSYHSLIILICTVIFGFTTVSLVEATTAFEREFSPFIKLNCSQCELTPNNKAKHRQYAISMNRQCRDQPEQFFKPCDPKIKPRGCGKVISQSRDISTPGQLKEMTVVRRFCTSDALDKCTEYDGVASNSVICVCTGNNCNHGNPVAVRVGYPLIVLPSLVLAVVFV